MSPVAVALLRRVAVYALVLAVLMLVVPRALTELGLMGPTAQDEIDATARALEAARSYGAKPGDPALAAAERELDRARQLAARDERRQARRVAVAARARAVEAQRRALAAREEGRRRAEAIVKEIDLLVGELEDVYGEVTTRLDKPQVARLLSLMKNARQTGASLSLAYEQGSYDKVIADEKGVKDVLISVKQELNAARPADKD